MNADASIKQNIITYTHQFFNTILLTILNIVKPIKPIPTYMVNGLPSRWEVSQVIIQCSLNLSNRLLHTVLLVCTNSFIATLQLHLVPNHYYVTNYPCNLGNTAQLVPGSQTIVCLMYYLPVFSNLSHLINHIVQETVFFLLCRC